MLGMEGVEAKTLPPFLEDQKRDQKKSTNTCTSMSTLFIGTHGF